MNINLHKNHRLLFGIVFWGFVALSLLIAVLPATWVQDNNQPLPASKPMTDLQREGLHVFLDEGCVYCHTQQVRPIKVDENWGRPSAPGDYARINRWGVWRQTPGILGSERTGPDLTNIGKRQPSEVWQYMHLYNPRSVVKESIMPPFPFLFEVKENPEPDEAVIVLPDGFGPSKGKVVPTHRAEALVAYLKSLKQVSLNARPSADQRPKADSASAAATKNEIDGASIYANNCSSCHQNNGGGIPGAFPALSEAPAVTNNDPTEHIRIVLYGLQGKKINGKTYSAAMPPWGKQLSDEEVAAVINHERTSWGNNAPTVTADDVARIRNDKSLGKIQPN
ncbi:MAG: cbb3-type cytochrome c oxidase subunit II [Balneolaceae bacterium]|jgi:cytochrome c oxidase cbb3-type subunit 2